MANISFTPTFSNTDFVDGADRVRAGEPNGINARFNAIETDLRQLSLVVGAVDTALNTVHAGPSQHLLALPPAMVSIGFQAWTFGAGGATASHFGSTGILDLELPDGVRLLSFRAVGQAAATTTTIAITLLRVAIGGGAVQELASLVGGTNPFDREAPVDPDFAVTNPARFRYLVKADVPAFPDGQIMTISNFQLTYSTD